ncbi:MAG: hypothetical protein EBR82_03965 [Caulobacteraceae bacterium]|nr:hypothetical protein [Caulobacteraceae bacterium]
MGTDRSRFFAKFSEVTIHRRRHLGGWLTPPERPISGETAGSAWIDGSAWGAGPFLPPEAPPFRTAPKDPMALRSKNPRVKSRSKPHDDPPRPAPNLPLLRCGPLLSGAHRS